MTTPRALPVTALMVTEAAAAVAGRVVATPCTSSPALSALTGTTVFVKLENLQRTGSFKDRGALRKLLSLDAAQRARGVVAMSAGNHGQGVAHQAAALGIPATIVLPQGTPFTKVARTAQLGARVVVAGASVAEAETVARELASDEGSVFVHPYDDPLVVAGQGTVGLEIVEAVRDADVIVAPVGGGGLLAGVAVAARAAAPHIELVGVQSELFPAVSAAYHDVADVPRSRSISIADGIAVTEPGRVTLPMLRALVDDVTTVREASIEEAMTHYLELEKTVAEGAGAAPLALLLEQPDRFTGRRVVLVVSGGNVDPRVLSSVILRGLGRQGRLTRLYVETDDLPGQLARIAAVLGDAGANIVEVEHGRLASEVAPRRARVSFVIETVDVDHAADVVDALGAAGFAVERQPL
ncbi:MAG TPA: threonine ammonia-lyase [Acidimicrobiia bacterium]|nr:threonine ammonia-lyase [Acidimicrobiia bacterium]